ncbi:hypothetical protein INQ40_01830 [Lysobacter sp. H21R4]|uniref:hypothetical protein n=1 Tax=Lysobacter sp. H21R4 TaxID=2781021 RepID=UPI00188898D7|nr:hypothetical protein [Lysobacter sp. H21R4]QOY63056.1 hypothetical protein INQ40_01830 [Lysobacter sp. H21R4]
MSTISAMLWVLMWPATGCSQSRVDHKIDGLTGVVFNYSDEVIAEVRVDGELAGTGYEAVRPGNVTGGGGSCCMALAPTLDTVPVEITPGIADPYTVQATIENPWPKGASTAIVHVLPGRRVVIETTLGIGIGPRSDLLNAQLEALGIVKEVDIDWMMIPERYQYSEYMERGR